MTLLSKTKVLNNFPYLLQFYELQQNREMEEFLERDSSGTVDGTGAETESPAAAWRAKPMEPRQKQRREWKRREE
ncbi:hypothetical protein K0M31_004747 [Melipona bicolor]|uniref:Uncharacterized protein n=1 Tax=Melipona bicolor TaxID=60889 RepID=A0AA40FVP0_9HYME|nr:hypothetical protein K0M31_004747 [Melipona bicolor]